MMKHKEIKRLGRPTRVDMAGTLGQLLVDVAWKYAISRNEAIKALRRELQGMKG